MWRKVKSWIGNTVLETLWQSGRPTSPYTNYQMGIQTEYPSKGSRTSKLFVLAKTRGILVEPLHVRSAAKLCTSWQLVLLVTYNSTPGSFAHQNQTGFRITVRTQSTYVYCVNVAQNTTRNVYIHAKQAVRWCMEARVYVDLCVLSSLLCQVRFTYWSHTPLI